MFKFSLMTFQTFNINVPSDILLTINETEVEFEKRIKISIATTLFLEEKLTIGKAAELAEMSKYEFENLLSKNKIPISLLSINEVLSDIEKLKM